MKLTIEVQSLGIRDTELVKIDFGNSKVIKTHHARIFYKIEPEGLPNDIWLSDDGDILCKVYKKHTAISNLCKIRIYGAEMPHSLFVDGFEVTKGANMYMDT